MPTIFAKIINREIPAYIVYEDDIVIAFLDISQTTKGHTLVVTKTPYKDIFDVSEEAMSHLSKVVRKLSVAIKNAFGVEGINILNNSGEIAGQTVFHFHMHLIPRYEKTEITLSLPNHMNELTVDIYKERAEKIRAALS
jgi:histidine triad (HIT) family protein